MTDHAFTRPGLIAPEGETKWYEGAGIVEAAMGVKDGLYEGDVASFLGNTAVVGLSAIGAIMDPFQVIFAAGVGWLMEHVSFLREPLDWLAGDPKEIEGHAATWRAIGQRTHEATALYADEVRRSTAHWTSQAASAYRQRATAHAADVQALSTVAETMAELTLVAGAMVGVVRNTVRDVIAEVVGAAVSKAVQAALVVTIPKVVAEVALLVAECSAKILNLLKRLVATIGKLSGDLSMINSVLHRIDGSLRQAGDKALVLGAYRAQAAHVSATSTDAALIRGRAAWTEISDVHRKTYGDTARIAGDKLRTAPRDNAIQNSGSAADKIGDEDERPPIELPL